MKKIIFYTRVSKKNDVFEGGMARELALKNYLKNMNAEFVELKNTKIGKILNIFKYFRLLYMKNTNIILQYPCTGIPFLTEGMIQKSLLEIYKYIILRASDRNNVIYDIADLPYEQSVDLELKKLSKENLEKFEKELFSNLKINFIFASRSMAEYVERKYNVKLNKCICENGGIEPIKRKIQLQKEIMDEDKIKFIYAGTLNKGRQIERLIEKFPEKSDRVLILIGNSGEWLKNYKLKKNIKYLGSFNEADAAYMTSLCDVGLIPYDSSKKYYQIAYPTKLSFYISQGIPIISTDVLEVRRIVKKYDIGYLLEIDNWDEIFNTLDRNQVIEKKKNIEEVLEKFYWKSIFNKMERFIR